METLFLRADVWNPKKLEELFTRLNPNRNSVLNVNAWQGKKSKHPERNEETEQVVQHLLPTFLIQNSDQNSYLARVTVLIIRLGI